MTTITVVWPDGVRQSADTPEDLLELIAKTQWLATSSLDVRRLLAQRAEVWAGEPVDKRLPAYKLLLDLEQAGMLQLEEGFTGGAPS